MTDTKLLAALISKKGIKKGKIAEKLNVSYNTLKRKINNEVPFNASEITIMCDVLQIESLREKEAIFFAVNVGK